jgi:hypothetical protein
LAPGELVLKVCDLKLLLVQFALLLGKTVTERFDFRQSLLVHENEKKIKSRFFFKFPYKNTILAGNATMVNKGTLDS